MKPGLTLIFALAALFLSGTASAQWLVLDLPTMMREAMWWMNVAMYGRYGAIALVIASACVSHFKPRLGALLPSLLLVGAALSRIVPVIAAAHSKYGTAPIVERAMAFMPAPDLALVTAFALSAFLIVKRRADRVDVELLGA